MKIDNDEFGEMSLEEHSERILTGLGVILCDANVEYLTNQLTDLITHVIHLKQLHNEEILARLEKTTFPEPIDEMIPL